MNERIYIGIDLGGSKIEIIALDRKQNEIYRRRIATPSGDYEATLVVMTSLVEQAEQNLKSRGTIGIGTPGAISKLTGLLKNSNSVCLNGKPLRDDLERLLNRPIRFANDADCFALSESLGGAGKSAAIVFGVILGTGVGGGIVVEGSLLKGPNSIAGEWGHNPLPWPEQNEIPGPACYCGKRGCIETYLSGPGLSAVYYQLSGETVDAEEIAERAEQADEMSDKCLRIYENRLARALSHVINILDPEVIVLGGGLSNMKHLYSNVPKLWGRYIFSDSIETRLVPPKFGDSSGARGAALLWR
jgi:fructokinase